MIIIGIFECGCCQEANLSTIEIVRCTKQEYPKIVDLMKKHSAQFQCRQAPATAIFIFTNDEYIFLQSDEEKKMQEEMKTSNFYKYDEYLKAWEKDDKDEQYKENIRIDKEIENEIKSQKR